MSTLEQLGTWLQKQKADLTEEGPVLRFELWHVVDGDTGERLSKNRADVDDADLSAELWEAAEQDAGTRLGGQPQRYVVQAFREDPDAECYFPFVVKSRGISALLGSGTDPPNERGLQGQLMRHAEEAHRLVVQLTEATAGRLARDNEQLRRRAEAAETNLLGSYTAQQDLLDRKQERDLDMAKETAKAKRHEDILGMFMSMGPLLVGKFLGGSAPGLASSARDVAIGKLLKNLSPEEAASVFGALGTENKAVLMQLYESYREDDARDQEKRHPVLKDKATEPEDESEDATTH